MKILIVLSMFLVIFSQKVAAQTFSVKEDSIIVDDYINTINPNHLFTGDPNKICIVYINDKHGRIKTARYIEDSVITETEYGYDGVGNRTYSRIQSYYLNKNCHWYYYGLDLDLAYQKKFLPKSVGN